MESYNIRRARKKEAEQVAALWEQFLAEQEKLEERFRAADDASERWLNDFPLWLEDETRRIFVAENGGSIAGFISVHRTGPPPIYADASEVYVDEIYVVPEHRGKGIGGELVGKVRAWAEELAADRLRFACLSNNDAARAFWQKQQARSFYTTMTIELEGQVQNDKPASRRLGF